MHARLKETVEIGKYFFGERREDARVLVDRGGNIREAVLPGYRRPRSPREKPSYKP